MKLFCSFISVVSAITDFFSRILHLKVKYACGHRDKRKYTIVLLGETIEFMDEWFKKRLKCSACELAHTEKVAIRCAYLECGKPILPGEAVCAVIPNWELPPWAVFTSERKDSVLTCAHAGNGLGWCGNWSEEGLVRPPSSAAVSGQ